jgi:hypothetical protein
MMPRAKLNSGDNNTDRSFLEKEFLMSKYTAKFAKYDQGKLFVPGDGFIV